MADDNDIIEDVDLDDEGGDGLPSFSGGLPSFSGGASSSTAASWTARKSPVQGGGSGGGERQVGKKNKREAELADNDGGMSAHSDSTGNTPVKKPKKKKTAEEKKADKEAGLTKGSGKSPAKSKGKAAKAAAGEPKDGGDEEGGDDAEGDDKKGDDKDGKKEGDDEGDGDEDGEDDLDVDEDEKYKDEFRQRETELWNSCSEDEWKRYEAMRQSRFNDQGVKHIVSQVTEMPASIFNTAAGKPIFFTISGVAKIYVGELVDTARLVRREWGENEGEPLQPRHIREASRRLSRNELGKIPVLSRKKPLFKR